MNTFACMLLLLSAAVPAQNCANVSIGQVPLNDLGVGSYQGFVGGLYGAGLNEPPTTHRLLGLARMADVTPRDGVGVPSPSGRIVLLSIGMSNTTQEYSTWLATAATDPNKNPAVTIVDGAQGGQDAITISNPAANFWTVVDQRLAAAGVTRQQVQVVWLKEAIAGVNGGFPAAAQQLQSLLAQIVGILRQRFPNCALCFCSSRTYAGYATVALNPEPYAYESGFAVQWLIGQQMSGDVTLNCDPAAGLVLAPWLGFGPYLWTDGTTPRSDTLTWTCADVQPDGTHPSPAGRQKVAALLQQFFTTDGRAAPWYVRPGANATVTQYGSGCAGTNGLPQFRTNGRPSIGNANFRVGVELAAANALTLLAWSTAPAALPLAGPCNLLVDPSAGLPVSLGITSAIGSRSEPLPIANATWLIGAELCGQWFINDAAGAPFPGVLGITATRGARLHIGL